MPILPDCLVADWFVAKSVLTKNYAVESILKHRRAQTSVAAPMWAPARRVERGIAAGSFVYPAG
jgi:hypothetical protein